MGGNFTEHNYYLHLFNYNGAIEALEKELERIKKSGKTTLWYHSGKETLERLRGGQHLIKKGRKGELSLTPYDVNNIIYALLKKLKE